MSCCQADLKVFQADLKVCQADLKVRLYTRAEAGLLTRLVGTGGETAAYAARVEAGPLTRLVRRRVEAGL